MFKYFFCTFCIFILQFCDVTSNICCTPDQWEAFIFLDTGDAFFPDENKHFREQDEETQYSFTNGTLSLSYDLTNQRLLYYINATDYGSQYPKPTTDIRLYLDDHKQGIEYFVWNGECIKRKIDTNMPQLCVPDGAKRAETRSIGLASIQTVRYVFEQETTVCNVSATMTTDSCLPLHVMYYLDFGSFPGSITYLYNLDVVDISTGIKDPSVFNIPKECKNATFSNSIKVTRKPLIRRILDSFHNN